MASHSRWISAACWRSGVAEKSADKVTTSSCQGGEAGTVRSIRTCADSGLGQRLHGSLIVNVCVPALRAACVLCQFKKNPGFYGPKLRYEAEILAFILAEAGQRDLLPGRPDAS